MEQVDTERPRTADAASNLAFGLPFDASLDELEDRRRETHAAIEEAVAECMTRAGFEYVPVRWEQAAVQRGAGLSEWDYASEFGFGVSTDAIPPAPPTNPNDEYLAGLSPSALQAYVQALEGSPPPLDAEAAEGRGGCYGEAIDTLDLLPTDSINFISEATDAVNSRVDSDPDVVMLYREWQRCMTSEGLDVQATPSELVNSIASDWQALDRSLDESVSEFQDYERYVATQHIRCWSPFRDEYNEIREREFESFFEENQELVFTVESQRESAN